MAKKTIGLDYSEFSILTKQLEAMNGDIKKTTELALKKSQRYVHQKLGQEMNKHNQTFQTVKSLVDNPSVTWVGGTKAEIPVGFSIREGGLASIFLMYGTPRMKKDTALYNAIYGNKTNDELVALQSEVFFEEIGKLTGG